MLLTSKTHERDNAVDDGGSMPVPVAPCCADIEPVIHFSPAENLEHFDVVLIDRAPGPAALTDALDSILAALAHRK